VTVAGNNERTLNAGAGERARGNATTGRVGNKHFVSRTFVSDPFFGFSRKRQIVLEIFFVSKYGR
jgi:hypothetical protein